MNERTDVMVAPEPPMQICSTLTNELQSMNDALLQLQGSVQMLAQAVGCLHGEDSIAIPGPSPTEGIGLYGELAQYKTIVMETAKTIEDLVKKI